jgi:hypothetical protein
MLVLLNSLAYPGMAEKPKSRSQAKTQFYAEMELDAEPTYPERRLWMAIILHAITEYEEQLRHIQKLWKADRKPVSKHLLTFLRGLRYEVRHDWFRHVCDLANIDQSHVISRIKQLDEQYHVAQVKFSGEDTMATRYQLMKAKKRLQYG